MFRYDHYDEKVDNEWHSLVMFCLVTCVVPMVALWAYLPDRRLRDWAIREVSGLDIRYRA